MAYMYIKPVQKSETDNIEGFFPFLMQIDKVVTQLQLSPIRTAKREKRSYIEKILKTTTICDQNNETTTQQLQYVKDQ